MDFVNATNLESGFTVGARPDGRELLVVVVKGTFTIPAQPADAAKLADEQAKLVACDVFTGEPGLSAPRYEIDFAPVKPRCDILLTGNAHAPGGKPASRVKVALHVGSWSKSFDVVGNRVWEVGFSGLHATSPEPFQVLPISYNNAFGGVDRTHADPARHRWYAANHAGVGYREFVLLLASIQGTPLPNTEETGKPINAPWTEHRPMAFGAVGRAWQPRAALAGTYDQAWLDRQFPFLPHDFNELYYQAAPTDQQTDHLQGGEVVELMNLTPDGQTEFRLPKMNVPIDVYMKRGGHERIFGKLDTLTIEPNQQRFLLCARTTIELQRGLHEVERVVVGRKLAPRPSAARSHRAPPSKLRFKSLRQLVAWRRGTRKPS